MAITSIVKRIIEEVLPFVTFRSGAKQQWRLVYKNEEILQQEEYRYYSEIGLEDLDRRLIEERKRGSAMDEKTYKLALSLSVALTILGSILTTLAKLVTHTPAKICFLILAIASILCFLVSGFIALRALSTLPLYGYGTRILLIDRDELQQCLAMCLAQNEAINIIRHLRNEAAYQTLRNGFILFTLAAIPLVYSLVRSVFQ